MNHITPYREDAIRIQTNTEPSELRDFIRKRVEEPLQFGDVTVWNFGNHEVNRQAVQSKVRKDELLMDEYVIPYQLSSAWCYMHHLLPHRLRRLDWLIYAASDGTYTAFPNHLRISETEADRAFRAELANEI